MTRRRSLHLAADAAYAASSALQLLLLLQSSSSYPRIQQGHAHLLKSGALPGDTRLGTKLLSLYSALRRFRDAALLLDGIEEPDPFCFSNLISALSKSGDRASSAAFALFRRMLCRGLPPDRFVLPSVLKACAGGLQPSALLAGRQVHALALAGGCAGDPFVQTSLLHMYLSCDRTSAAQRVFDGMANRSVVPWSAMVGGYARSGCVGEALRAFVLMCESGVEPNAVTWNGMIAGFGASGFSREAACALRRMHSQGFRPDGSSVSSVLPAIGDLEDVAAGMQVHALAVKCGLQESDGCVVSALVGMYGRCGCVEEIVRVFGDAGRPDDVGCCNALVSGLSHNNRVDDALMLFREWVAGGAVELNVVSWTSIIGCCSQNGRDVEALELFRDMQTVGLLKPNSVTIPCVLPACANVAALMHGKSCHGFCVRNGISRDVYVGSSLVDMYAKCGRIGDARRVFDAMPSRNVVSWNAMLGGYAMHGKAGDAALLFDSMQRIGQNPDAITFTCLLAACGQAGLTEQGLRYFEAMSSGRHGGIAPRMEHYACVVSLLGRSGKVGRAYAVIGRMPLQPDACVWGALLSACRVHGDVVLGEIAAQKLFELEPGNVGNYVLMSNIYAAKGMWDRVGRVRDAMRTMGLKKNPGYSWIEVGKLLHMLVAGDKSHPQMAQILERLEDLGAEMRRLGYLPSTDLVLQDVEEQDKELMLCGHSEKLAVALGLLNTSPGTPLRVIKNLRICGDCHTVMKFVSRFEGREIFVRDTNRFHHFKDGLCSCGDYW